MRVEEGDDVGTILGIAESGESHLRPRRELFGAGQPFGQLGEIPGAALAGQRLGEGEAICPLADRLADDAPQVRAERIGAALVGVVAGGALLEHLLALGRIGGRQIEFDRLGRLGACAFLDYAFDRKAHGFGPGSVEYLA